MTYDWHLSVPFLLRIIFLKIALPLLWLSHRVIFGVTWSFSKTDINSGSGFSSDWKSSAAVQSSLGRILWKISLLMKGKAFVQFTDQLITKLMQCWIMAINNFGNTSIILRWKFYKQVILYRKWFSGMI